MAPIVVIRINWKPADSPVDYKRDPKPNAGAWRADAIEPFKEYHEAFRHDRGAGDVELGCAWSTVIDTQDAIVLDGIGANADRENETLSVIDRGIVMFRAMLFQAMADVEQGQDPLGVVRDVAKNDSIRVNATEELLDPESYRSAKTKYVAA